MVGKFLNYYSITGCYAAIEQAFHTVDVYKQE